MLFLEIIWMVGLSFTIQLIIVLGGVQKWRNDFVEFSLTVLNFQYFLDIRPRKPLSVSSYLIYEFCLTRKHVPTPQSPIFQLKTKNVSDQSSCWIHTLKSPSQSSQDLAWSTYRKFFEFLKICGPFFCLEYFTEVDQL